MKIYFSKAAGVWGIQDSATTNGELIIFLHDYVLSLLGSVLVVVAFVIILVYIQYTFNLQSQKYEIQIKRPYRQKRRFVLALLGKVWKVRSKLGQVNTSKIVSVLDERRLIPRMRKVKRYRRMRDLHQITFKNHHRVERMVRASQAKALKGTRRFIYWRDGRWFDIPFGVPYYHFARLLQRIRIKSKLRRRVFFHTKRHIFLNLVLRFTKRLKLRKVFQVWKKRISRKFAKRVMKSTAWKLRRHQFKTKYVHWKNYTDHKIKKKISLQLFILAPIRGIVIGFAKHIDQYHINLMKYQFFTERVLFFRMLLQNKDLIYHEKTGKSVLTYKHKLEKFQLKLQNKIEIFQNIFIFIRMHQSITIKENAPKYLNMRLFEVYHKRDSLMKDEILYYLGFEIWNMNKFRFYFIWIKLMFINSFFNEKNTYTWISARDKWSRDLYQHLDHVQWEQLRFSAYQFLDKRRSTRRAYVKKLRFMFNLKINTKQWFNTKKREEIRSIPRSQVSSLEMSLWWWTKFFSKKAYLDRMHLTQELRFHRRDWIQLGGVSRQRSLLRYIWRREVKFKKQKIHKEFNPFVSKRIRFWSRGMTPADLWRSLFLFNTGVMQKDQNANNPINKSHLLSLNKFRHYKILEFFWTLIPAIYLVLIGWPSLSVLYSLDEPVNPELTVKALGNQWFWKYEYSINFVDIDSKDPFAFDVLYLSYESHIVNEEDLRQGELRLLEVDYWMLLPMNVEVRLLVSSVDVIHSFAVPSLGVKIDAVPGRLNEVLIFIKRKGVFYGQCSELCGVNHAFMPIIIQTMNYSTFEGLYFNFIRKS